MDKNIIMFIIHETTVTALVNILKVNTIYKSSKILELNLKTGQSGRCKIITTDPRIFLTHSNKDVDEVDGVYFRLVIDIPTKLIYGDCILVFPFDILNDNKFIINTEENHGFCIAEDGIVAESQFSGEEGMTITNLKNFYLLEKYTFEHYSSEVVIMDNVDLTNLVSIFVKTDKVNAELTSLFKQKNLIPFKP
jgi:hypothetical protein